MVIWSLKKYWDLHSNGRFLVASEMNYNLRKFKKVEGDFPPLNITMFDLKGIFICLVD